MRAGRAGLLAVAAALVGGWSVGQPAPVDAATPAASSPSAIGSYAVYWIAVSPAYQRTGLVVAMATPFGTNPSGCPNGCLYLYVSHDGGASWQRSPATGWQQGRPTIAVDASGHEVVLAASSSALQRSDDDGTTWKTIFTSGGIPAISPQFARDGGVAVAGKPDYVVQKGAAHNVSGSGGAMADEAFMYAPTYPSGGRYAPVLLSGADTKTALPLVMRCTADFSCSGPAAQFAGSGTWSIPAMLFPSTDYANDGVVFAQTGRGIYKSVDGGGSFVPLTVVSTNNATTPSTAMLALDPHYRESGLRNVYVSVFQIVGTGQSQHGNGGIYKSSDGGATWSRLGSPSPLDDGAMSVALAPDGRLFAGYLDGSNGGHAGLLCSEDGGAHWKPTCSPVGGNAGGSRTSTKPPGTSATCTGSACAGSGGASTQSGGTATGSNGAPAGNADGSAGGDGPLGPSTGTTAPLHPGSSPLKYVALGLIPVLVLGAVVSALLRRRRAHGPPAAPTVE